MPSSHPSLGLSAFFLSFCAAAMNSFSSFTSRPRDTPITAGTASQAQPRRKNNRSPPYQLVASLSLALSGAAARPATAAPGLVSTVSDGLMAPTDADETERVGFVLQKLSISPTLYEAPNRPEPAEHSSPGSVESAPGCDRLVPSSNPVGPAAGRVMARQSCRACPTSLATLARLGWPLGMTTSRL